VWFPLDVSRYVINMIIINSRDWSTQGTLAVSSVDVEDVVSWIVLPYAGNLLPA